MEKKTKVLLTDLSYLNHNYGAQGISFSFMNKLNGYIDAEYVFVLPKKHYKENFLFAKNNYFNIVCNSGENFFLERGSVFFFLYKIIYFLKKRKTITKKEERIYLKLIETIKKSDIIVDLSGIEFIGNRGLKTKWLDYLKTIFFQRLSHKLKKPYFKYTKSYGPISGKIYTFFVKRKLKKLPFIFVRGRDNLEEIKKLKLKVPLYSFPDVSIALRPADKNWAVDYVKKIGIDVSKPIIGISP
ncbi:MAG: polysaccharide pyruvyl transferase family protein, partial [Candidatus Pacebacteria bacterium]|nr:polysaccharide pyruvyl transferase family protein [Candidatus Paceibacterota bacterium]